MQVGVIGGIYLLAFLLSEGRAEEFNSLTESKNLQDVDRVNEAPSDLKNELSLAVSQSNSRDNEGRSGNIAHSDERDFEDSAMSNAVAQSSSEGFTLSESDRIGDSSRSGASAIEGSSQFNPFNEKLGPYVLPGSSFSQANAQAVSGGPYGQGLSSYPYDSSLSSNFGSSSAQSQAGNGLFPPFHNFNLQPNNGIYQRDPDYNPYQELSSVQAENHADNRLFNSGYDGLPNVSPYNQGSRFPQTAGHSDSQLHQPIIKPIAILPKPNPRINPVRDSLSAFYSSYPYIPKSTYSSVNTKFQESLYQPIPVPNSHFSQYDRFLVPYVGPNTTQTQSEAYQSVPKRSKEDRYDINTISSRQGQKSDYGFASLNSYGQSEPYQAIPLPDPKMNIGRQGENNEYEYQPVSNTHDPKSDASLTSATSSNVASSSEYNASTDDIDSNVDLESRSEWVPLEYKPISPNGPNPQLYPSGAVTAQGIPDSNAAANAVNLYSLGISPYASFYPSESPYRPGGYKPAENENQGSTNDFTSWQISPIAFEHAESRVIMPFEYVFPSKMRGGENTIQCTKENEFHHFWSKRQDCLVCICLNEYGVLLPVCASCGGCRNSPPKLPEQVPQLPDINPIEPSSPEPYPPVPQPEPSFPTPGPYVDFPEPVPTPAPVPVPFTEPAVTLPPPPPHAQCKPLPTGQPFTNPLHPCQICICKESFLTGKNEVQIECKENPQCIAPADVTALPPIPDIPKPIPLPTCEKFPENVLFPHPTETCKLCKCSKSLSEDGNVEQQITCYPHPECLPKLEATTDPIPPLPLPVDPYQVKPNPEPGPIPPDSLKEPTEPVPLPEVVTVEPLPWPPITTTAVVPMLPVLTPRPGPLPGPSPHESCQPYPPNQTFQHPWDECQVCLCTEAIAVGMITVEVNCYTKPECCIVPPDSARPGLPGNLLLLTGFTMPLGLSNVANIPDTMSQPITSTFKPPSIYPSYSPAPVNVYSGSKQSTESLNQPPLYPVLMEPSSSYPYQPNYAHAYVNTQFSEYPPRSSVQPGTGNTIGMYNSNNFGYPADYKYAKGDAIGSSYLPQGHLQTFDPRIQSIPAPSYSGMYQRANYERPSMYSSEQFRVNAPVATLGGPKPQYMAPGYAGAIGYTKSGKDLPDLDDLQ